MQEGVTSSRIPEKMTLLEKAQVSLAICTTINRKYRPCGVRGILTH